MIVQKSFKTQSRMKDNRRSLLDNFQCEQFKYSTIPMRQFQCSTIPRQTLNLLVLDRLDDFYCKDIYKSSSLPISQHLSGFTELYQDCTFNCCDILSKICRHSLSRGKRYGCGPLETLNKSI